jgi:hypothetical protein
LSPDSRSQLHDESGDAREATAAISEYPNSDLVEYNNLRQQ